MKRSNIILLGGLVLGILLLLGAQAALYAKYKRGNYTLVTDTWQQNLVNALFPQVHHVSVDNVGSATIEAADVNSLQYSKDAPVQYKIQGDTLFISSKDSNSAERRYNSVITLRLGSTLTMHVRSTTLNILGSGKAYPDLALTLDSSDTYFAAREPNEIPSFSNLTIRASGSNLNMNDVKAKKLDVSLRSSGISEGARASIDSLRISGDATSNINMKIENLSKAKINRINE